MKILISGGDGQLVRCITDELCKYNGEYEWHSYSRENWDVTDFEFSRKKFEVHNPDIYIHGASIHSAADIHRDARLGAEVNIAATHDLIKLCNEFRTTFINFSTDYVFGFNPPCLSLDYTRSDNVSPVNIYGVMKAAIENMLHGYCNEFTNIRVSGLFSKYGSRAKGGMCFPKMILNKIDLGEEIQVVNDQHCTIGYCPEIAEHVVMMFEDNRHVLNQNEHFCNSGILTWYDLAKFICEIKNYDNLKPTTTEEFYSEFRRSDNTALQATEEFERWETAVIKYLIDMGELRVES